MNSERFRRIRVIFEAASDRSVEARAAFLKEECKDDYALLAEVEALLEAAAGTDWLLDWRRHLRDDEPEPSKPQSLPPGTSLCNRYRIVKLIGYGGMGAVYQALDSELTGEDTKEWIAVKLILGQYANHKDLVRRFREEILLARHVTHRNVVRIFSLEKDGDLLFITMEFVEGRDLATLLDEHGPFAPVEATKIMYQAASGIEAAHTANVLHRDLKTRNIMMQPDGRVVVMDFGLARPLDNQSRTETAGVLGTFAYMAPEQLLLQPADHRADVYSLGVVFHELLTGKLPPRVGSVEQRGKDALSGVLQAKSEQGAKAHQELNRIVCKCLEDDPKNRYQSAQELREDIERWLYPAATVARFPRWGIWLTAAGIVCAFLIAWSIWRKPASPPQEHPPVTVLIADFANHTDAAVFSSGTLESVLSISLEESPFIASYSRDAAHKTARLLGGSVLTEELAHTIAVREGIEYVVAGSLDRQAGRYVENVSVSDAEGMAPPNAHRVTASSREQVLTAVGEIAHDIRRDLGEKKPPRQRPETFTSSSLDAIHAYSVAQELTLNGKGNDAIAEYNHAILLDPSLGRAYSGLAVIYRNKYQIDEALKYFDQALKHVDHMTDREKFRTRGNYYATLGVPDKAIYEYSQLVKQYPADNAGWANLALVWALQRDMAKAVEYGREPLKIYPKNVAQRSNLAWYLLYDGQYGEAITEAKQALEFNRAYVKAYVVMALAQLAQGNVTDAEKTYNDLRLVSADGASTAALGLADVALYQGRMEEASNLLENGANSDLATHNALGAARKLAILAQADLAMGKVAEASTAAARGDSAQSKEDGVMFQLAQVFVQLNPARASEIASQMGESLNRDRRCYALLLSGELSLQAGETQSAIVHFEDALKLVDAWLVRYDLGLAYLKAKRYAEADDELESCLRRRGEAASAFIDDTPTYRDVPAVYYYHGLAEDGVGVASAKQWYQDFLDIKTGGGPDEMIDKARQRLRTAGNGGFDHAADGREAQPRGPKEKSLLAPARSRSHPKK